MPLDKLCEKKHLVDLDDPNYQLLKPLSVNIENENGVITANIPELNIFCADDNVDDAMVGLKSAVRDLYNDLTNDSELLAQASPEWKQLVNVITRKY